MLCGSNKEIQLLTTDFLTLIKQIPKAELHCHLEGSVNPEILKSLLEKYGVVLPRTGQQEANSLYEFSNLKDFLRIFGTVCSLLREAVDFQEIVVDLGKDAKRQHIWYREIMFTYEYHRSRGIPWEIVYEGLKNGREIVKSKYGVEIRYIAEIAYPSNQLDALRQVEYAGDSIDAGIVAIGQDSLGNGYDECRHTNAFKKAASLGLRRTSHAGEGVGPKSIWDAIRLLGVDRIDHGVRSIEDPNLVAFLKESKIPLTICPLSNIALNIFPDMRSHPFEYLYKNEINVNLNSDDPEMFRRDLIENYINVIDTFKFSEANIIEIARNSFTAAFSEEKERLNYLKLFDFEIDKLVSKESRHIEKK